jgi:sugar transferase EpsL
VRILPVVPRIHLPMPSTSRLNVGHAIAALALLITSGPLIAIGLMAVLVESGRPVLFSQVRAGLNGRLFRMHKIRSMRIAASEDGNVDDAGRILATGRLLRATSIDELPSLWNVVRGDMALVGPRPLLPEYTERYSPEQRRRLEVKPGLTGWAQVNGRNSISWEEKFRLDVWYVDNRSLWLDIKILGMTIVQVLTRRGISAPSHATMPPFEGGGAEGSDSE